MNFQPSDLNASLLQLVKESEAITTIIVKMNKKKIILKS